MVFLPVSAPGILPEAESANELTKPTVQLTELTSKQQLQLAAVSGHFSSKQNYLSIKAGVYDS